MKTGIRHYENASCKVLMCVAIPNRLRTRTREIVSIDVPENLRRQGMATQLLRNICDEADAHRMTLIVFPKPFGDGPKMSQRDLIEWYDSKFGFRAIQAEPVMMARIPYASLRPPKLNFIAQVIDRNFK